MADTELVFNHVVELTKDAARSLNDAVMHRQMEAIVSSVNTANRKARGWTIALQPRYYEERGKFYWDEYKYTSTYASTTIYHIKLTVALDPAKARESTEKTEFQNIVNAIASRAETNGKWKVSKVDNVEYVAKSIEQQRETDDDVGYAPITLPDDWGSYFGHLFGVDPHISRVKRALDAALVSDWTHRFHCALIGPPGCGKSDICQSIKKALGEEAVLEFDATSTTMAGAQKELAERDELPRVLLVEEIEKAPENSLAWLLSVLDLRAEIRKTTARGNLLRDAKMLTIATVNDLPTFKRVNFGALESRFANKIFFQRPTRELLGKIVAREIERVNGDERWIQPTLDYAEEIDTTDPREVISIALCGREALLSGEYQNEMRKTGMEQEFRL